MDTYIVKNRLKYISDFAHAVDRNFREMDAYPDSCMNLLIKWIDELLDMIESESDMERLVCNAEHRKDVLENR